MREARDRAVARIGAQQRTVITTEQLIGAGLGKDAIAYRLRTGRLHVVFQGVYSIGCGPLPALAREHAALLACGERAFLSHRTAAFLWGLSAEEPAEVEVSVAGRRIRARKGLRVHSVGEVAKAELRRHEGLPVSSPARTLLEIAATCPSHLPEILDAGLGNRRLTRGDVEAVLSRHRGRRGAAWLAAILGDETAMTITRSDAEKAFLKLIRDSGLPRPLVNQRLGRYEPDFLWPEQRLIVELDSYGFHGGPIGFQRDREKDLFYRDAGFDVLRFTRAHVIYEPSRVLVRLTQALARRAVAA